MLRFPVTIVSILFYIFRITNAQGSCSKYLCRKPETQHCCYSTVVGTEINATCCNAGEICCGYGCCPGGIACINRACCYGKPCHQDRCEPLGTACDSQCLFGDNFVLLQDGSQKQLKNLRSGDQVYAINTQDQLVKDEIIMILHSGPKVETLFYTITTSSNQSVSLTGDHLIMTYNLHEKRSFMIAANELKINDYLLMGEMSGENAIPVSIRSVEVFFKTGFITPMTYTGTLLVNGIATSCYVKYHNTYNEMHALFYPFRLYYYLMKDVFRLTDEPYSIGMQVNSLVKEDEYYGHILVRYIHQSKVMVKYIVQDLMVNTFLSI